MNRLSSIVRDCLRGGVLLGVGVSSLVSGCSNYGNMVARSVGEYALMEGVAGAVRKEVEGPRGTVVNVGGGDFPVNYQPQNLEEAMAMTRQRNERAYRAAAAIPQDVVTPVKMELLVQYWKDFNGNNKIDDGEVLGRVEESVNLDKYGLRVELVTSSSNAITYYVVDFDGNKIGQNKKITGYWFTNGYSDVWEDSADWIDTMNKVSKKRPGKYTIYAQQDGYIEVFKKMITIGRNKIELSNKLTSSNK